MEPNPERKSLEMWETLSIEDRAILSDGIRRELLRLLLEVELFVPTRIESIKNQNADLKVVTLSLPIYVDVNKKPIFQIPEDIKNDLGKRKPELLGQLEEIVADFINPHRTNKDKSIQILQRIIESDTI